MDRRDLVTSIDDERRDTDSKRDDRPSLRQGDAHPSSDKENAHLSPSKQAGRPEHANDASERADPYQDSALASRREFLTRAVGGVAVGGLLAAGSLVLHRGRGQRLTKGQNLQPARSFRVVSPKGSPTGVMVTGSDLAKRLDAALNRLGGLGHFIKPGDRVLLKPNMAWDREPDYAATTNPALVELLIRRCKRAGAKQVIVSDHSVSDPHRAARRSGIEQACTKAGARLVIPGSNDYVTARLAGRRLQSWPVLSLLYKVDKIIDLPVPKHHSLSRMTGALKNWIGIAGGTRRRLHQDIGTTIVDLIAAFPPTLVVADASRVLMRHGPTGGRLSDVKETKVLVAGTDPATVDAALLPLLGLEPDQVTHLLNAVARGLGTTDLSIISRIHLDG